MKLKDIAHGAAAGALLIVGGTISAALIAPVAGAMAVAGAVVGGAALAAGAVQAAAEKIKASQDPKTKQKPPPGPSASS